MHTLRVLYVEPRPGAYDARPAYLAAQHAFGGGDLALAGAKLGEAMHLHLCGEAERWECWPKRTGRPKARRLARALFKAGRLSRFELGIVRGIIKISKTLSNRPELGKEILPLDRADGDRRCPSTLATALEIIQAFCDPSAGRCVATEGRRA